MTDLNKLKTIIATIMKVNESKVESSSSDNTDTWDSLNHMNLIVAVEEAFSIQFEDEEVLEITSFNAIKLSLLEKGISL